MEHAVIKLKKNTLRHLAIHTKVNGQRHKHTLIHTGSRTLRYIGRDTNSDIQADTSTHTDLQTK